MEMNSMWEERILKYSTEYKVKTSSGLKYWLKHNFNHWVMSWRKVIYCGSMREMNKWHDKIDYIELTDTSSLPYATKGEWGLFSKIDWTE